MSFIQRELDRIAEELRKNPNGEHYAELYAAQQALSWALEPGGFRGPYAMITSDPRDANPLNIPSAANIPEGLLSQPSSNVGRGASQSAGYSNRMRPPLGPLSPQVRFKPDKYDAQAEM